MLSHIVKSVESVVIVSSESKAPRESLLSPHCTVLCGKKKESVFG